MFGPVPSAPVTDHRTVSAAVARRFLVKRHLLTPPRSLPPEPASVLRVMDRLGSFQFDPLEVAGRNHDLLLLARIAGYRRAWTDAHLYETRDLYETYNKGLSLVRTAELPWHRITWDLNRAEHEGGAFDEHAPLVEELLDRIRRDGPLSSTDIESRPAIDWYWGPTNPVRAVLEALAEAGILGLSRREGNRRIYDLVERLFPADLLAERHPEDEQRRHKLLSRFRAHGLLGNAGEAVVWLGIAPAADRTRLRNDLVASGAIAPVGVEGVRGTRYVVASDLDDLAAAEREVEAGQPPGEADARRRVPRAARSAGVGPRPAAPALGLRLRLGGVRPGEEATLGLLRAADAVRRPARRAHRASPRPGDRHAPHPGHLVGGRLRPAGGPRVRSGLRGGDPGASRLRRTAAGRLAAGRPASAVRGVGPRPRGGASSTPEPGPPVHCRAGVWHDSPTPIDEPVAEVLPMSAIRRAEVTWSGELATGSGTVSAVSSGAFSDLPVSWAARTESPEGQTSPEELVAAAHASCFSMAFSAGLARNGTPPDRLDVSADVTFDKLEAGWRVVSSALTVRGRVPGISAEEFAALADAAKDGCPISQALQGNVALSVDAALEG